MTNMTNIIAIGDQHIKLDNIEETDIFMEEAVKSVRKINPHVIVLLGDMLDTHERIHSVPLNKAYVLIDKLREIANVYILVGNHDMINNQVYLTQDHWLNGLKEWSGVTVVDTVMCAEINGHKFVFCPYVYPGRFIEALNTLNAEEWKDAQCIFAHQEFYGCKMGAFVSVDGDKWPVEYPHVVSGHIHLNQKPQENIYYPGSSLAVAYGETTRNIFCSLTFKHGERGYDLEEIDLNLPKKRIVYTTMEEINNVSLDVSTKDKIKLSVSGEYIDFKTFKKSQKFKELSDQGVKVVFKQTRRNVLEQKKILSHIDDSVVTDFDSLLKTLVEKEDNKYLTEAYELAINDKDVLVI
jgi:DNA repair exonuclease SbcCD nuclease subunit